MEASSLSSFPSILTGMPPISSLSLANGCAIPVSSGTLWPQN